MTPPLSGTPRDPFAELTGCGNHSCLIRKPTGMGTNGACSCSRNGFAMQRFIRLARAEISRLTTENAELRRERDEARDRALFTVEMIIATVHDRERNAVPDDTHDGGHVAGELLAAVHSLRSPLSPDPANGR